MQIIKRILRPRGFSLVSRLAIRLSWLYCLFFLLWAVVILSLASITMYWGLFWGLVSFPLFVPLIVVLSFLEVQAITRSIQKEIYGTDV